MQLQPLLDSPRVRDLRARIHGLDAATVDEQVRLALIAAPPGAEAERGGYVAERFAALGLQAVHVDEVGNVLAWLPHPATADAEPAPVIVSAHLDTVFPAETPLSVRHERGRIYLPGIADNARGLAALLALATVLREAALITRHPILLVATVGEEGAGDLRGVKHLFRSGSPWSRAAAFISLDGSGLRRIVHRAVGSKRLRVTVTGQGGHSWSDWGLPNPLHALGEGVARLRAIRLPEEPRTTLTVARAQGGTSVNAIPETAWMELDLRSEASDPLQRLEAQVRDRMIAAVQAESNGHHRPGARLQLHWEVIGDRPGGATPATAPLVAIAEAATRAVGASPELASSSTDSNVPMSIGVPAVTVGAGGDSGGIHTTDEWYSNAGGALGIERALLLVLAAAAMT
jgi:tripeptide aminopeptidase